MTQLPLSPPPLPDSTPESISADLSCIHCGYNLRGLYPDGRCPECGELIQDSRQGHLLRYADVEWLKRLHFGTRLKYWSIGITILLNLMAGALVAFGPPGELFRVIGQIGAALGLWATMCITAQEPRVSLEENPVTLRKVVRGSAWAAFTCGLVGVMDPNASYVITPFIALLSGLAGIVTFGGELVYYRRFAVRIPDEKLAKSTRNLFWYAITVATLWVVMMGVVAILTTVVAKPPPLPGTAPPPMGGVLMMILAGGTLVLSLMMLIGLLWYVRMLIRYRKAFAEAIENRGV